MHFFMEKKSVTKQKVLQSKDIFNLAKSNVLLLMLKYDLGTFLTGSMRFTLLLHIYCSF